MLKDQTSYQKAKELILQNPDFNDFEGQKAESFFNIYISGTYREFLLDFGAGSFAI